MRMLDVDDFPRGLSLEVDRPAPAPPPAPLHSAGIETLRRCHVDGLPLDAWGDCARCSRARYEKAKREQRNLIFGVVVVVLAFAGLFLAGVLWGYAKERESRSAAAQVSAQHGGQLVVYTTQSCPACNVARNHLAQKGIPYVERRVDSDPSAFAELDRITKGKALVPTFVVGDEVLTGFDPTGMTLQQAMARKGMKDGAAAAP